MSVRNLTKSSNDFLFAAKDVFSFEKDFWKHIRAVIDEQLAAATDNHH
jgi:hypothetical protein